MNELINSNTAVAGRTVNLIAAEINSIKEQTRKMVLYNSIEIGRRLVEAKQLISHGEWGEWLEKSVDYSQSTANNLMRIFNEYGSEQLTLLDNNAKSQALGNLSYTQAIAMLGIPSEERENFIKEQDINNLSTRELQKAIKEREQALKEKQEAEEASAALTKTVESMKNANEKLKDEKDKEKVARLKAEQQALELRGQINDSVIQREAYLQQLDEYKTKLQEAQQDGNTEEVEKLTEKINALDDEVEKLRSEKEELEQQLKEKATDVITAEPQVIERVPEEIVKELQDLRGKVNNAVGNDKAVVKFSVQFDGLVKSFKELLGTLEEVQSEEVREKYKTAVKGLIGKMTERL
jgi:chromosome segregation ATPase